MLHGSPCASLISGQPLPGVISAGRPSCFVVVVKPGAAALLTAEQPIDLEIHIAGTGAEIAVDGFDSGPETATLPLPGEFRVEIRPVSGHENLPVRYLMSRKELPLQVAVKRSAAEQLATIAKHAGKEDNISAALTAWQGLGDASAIGRIYIELGEAVLAAGDPDSARRASESARESCLILSDLRCAAEAGNNSGVTSRQLGDFDLALARLTEAAGQFRRIGERKLEGVTLSNLGLLFRQTGDYQRAVGYYDQAGVILRSRDPLANARVLNNLGVCYQFLAEYGRARIYFDSALQEFAAQHSARDVARARLNLGRTYLLEGKNALARRTLDQALAEAVANSDRSTRALALNDLGQALLAEHSTEAAAQALRQALELDRVLGDRGVEAFSLHGLGDAALAAGDVAAARTDYTQAIGIRHECGLRDLESDSLFALARLEFGAGNASEARQAAERALGITESVRVQVPGAALRASFYARKRRFFDLLVEIDMAPGTPRAIEEGFLTAERGRGRALMDLLAEGTMGRQLTGELFQRRTGVQRQLDLLTVRLSVARPGRDGELRRQVELLAAQDQEIEASARQAFADWKLGKQLTSIAGFQQAHLPRGTALLEYYLGEKQSYLWVIDGAGARVFRLPPRAEIEARCAPVLRLFPDVLGRRRSPQTQRQFERALGQLSATLTGPLAGLGLPARLIIVPDGALNRIPFAALDLPGKRRFGLAHDLVQVPSAAYLTEGRKPRPTADFPKAILAIADPVYSSQDPRVAPNPRSVQGAVNSALSRITYRQELDTVVSLVPAGRRRFLQGFDANPDQLAKLPLRDYALLHFSTHALIDDRTPELSRVALSMVARSGQPVDGFLRPHQLSQFHLEGSTVVLSACETALGKQVLGEGLSGLTASLFRAGAAQLVLTLSNVDAEGSSEFLSATYRHVFGSRPEDLEHSVTLARRSLAASPRWSDPFYWASFVVYGIPTERGDATVSPTL